ncbi:MAG: hypothetical protein SGPRY_000874 [Prymnesium sp.]
MEGGKWLVFTQEGPQIYKVYRHKLQASARAQAERLWCCWVLFEALDAGGLKELSCGGIGPTFLIHPAIRAYAMNEYQSMARDSEARKAAAAAAEARFASANKQAPPAKPKLSTARADGKPDVSNPAVWD